MKVLLISIIFILFSSQSLASNLSLNDCHDEGINFIEKILQTPKGKEVLSKQFHITMLKMASLTNSDNLKTIEEYSKEWMNGLDPSEVASLAEISKEYKQNQQLKDLEIIEDKFLKANYYNKNFRFDNKEASAFALSHKLINEDSPFNEQDVSILWFASQMNEVAQRSTGKFSALYNKTSISSILTNYSGFNIGKRPLTKSELTELQNKHQKDYLKSLLEVENVLKTHLTALGCLDERGVVAGACNYGQNYFQSLLNVGIYNLESMINTDELNAITISNDLVAKYKGKAIFEFFPISESFVEEAQAIETTQWKLPPDKSKNIDPTLKLQETINDIPDLKQRVKSFAYHSKGDNYIIVDTQNNQIEYYNKSGTLLEKIPFEAQEDDRFQTGGAGVYRLNKIGKKGELFIQGQNSDKIRPIAKNISLKIDKNTPIVVLPKEKTSTLVVKDGELLFKKSMAPKNYYAYNYTNTSGREYKQIKISFSDKELEESELLTGFIDSLAKEKEKLMKIYNLTNDEYNLLAKFSFGVMKPESQMGTHWRYTLKETLPFVVSLKKWWDGNESANSRGPSQLKRIPAAIEKEYKITKSDLKNPRPAAVATLGFCAELLTELKRIKKFHRDIDEDNMIDYLYYLFRGKRSEIIKGSATPEDNKNIREIKKMADKLQFYQEA